MRHGSQARAGRRHALDRGPVRASELAEMVVCERRVVLAARLGETILQRDPAIGRGIRAHEQFLDDALRLNGCVDHDPIARKGRCFVATAVYGEGRETRVLRRFRDQVLRKTAGGRWLVGRYYEIGPRICRYLEGSRRRRAAMRWLLKPVVRFAAMFVGTDK